MLKMFFSLLIIMFSFMMLFLNHPLSMGLMILIQTLIICLLSGMLINSYWFSYILFLVFLGGLLVLFIYVSSVASNELFNMNFFLKNIMLFLLTLSLFFSFSYMYNLNWLNLSFNYEMKNMMNFFIFFNNENKINLSKLYNNQTHLLMMMLIIYLFITLVAIVKITNIFFGPIRSINY
uniref:NADH-ubiquinone oxidoreductase chain 6 n=2 Tax=Papilio TaxID=7145 RepID=I1SZA8_PAPBI|nr:NADH dehydrogenase subunit 6 [Papilio bianor]YP_009025096.1 NADH dehydrogenase subunit 6 [Papilio syfanius]YP_010485984.1 NADH dehydrogenase subunit 6 [Papilio dialis]AEI26112.1 NADH dehydrogenase subunit 6 [Papilio bianor]AGG19621.1 NADH dehydrogenase subunit 6 [Papilio bianor]AHH24451.1 NADH dehydrogenase subunit 6 [Papilio bianor]AHN95407.1 NADH dehydrogenase subunit 6 [Papilio syfanius]UVW82143.1 NADH dehydrogenase subunit 6 [Papilio dialis]